MAYAKYPLPPFPFLFGGTFIEGVKKVHAAPLEINISLPFRRDFH